MPVETRLLQKKTRGNHWHAKIFILKRGVVPIFGIIGSSNMTSRAFGLGPNFNFESDVVLWDTANNPINTLCLQQAATIDNNVNDLIFADYNNERNRGLTAMQRLELLETALDIENLENLES